MLEIRCGKLLQAVDAVRPCSNKTRIVHPGTQHALVQYADDGRFKASATDLCLWGQWQGVGGQGGAPGGFAVPLERLRDILRALDSEKAVRVEEHAGAIELTQARAHYRLSSMPVDDFPTLDSPEDEKTARLEIPAKDLLEVLGMAAHAAPKADPRINLNGVHVSTDGSSIHAVATDGARLAVAGTDPGPDAPAGTIPTASLPAIRHVLKGCPCDETVVLTVATHTVAVATEAATVKTLAVGHPYPDWRRAVPAEDGRVCTIRGDLLLETLTRVNPILHDARTSMGSFVFNDSALRVDTSGGSDTGVDYCEIEFDGGEEFKAIFAVEFWLDFLRAVRPERIAVHLIAPDAPCRVTPADAGPWAWVIMPFRA